ncbi:uncharacterized protein C1orf112 homolog isoform X3 [Carcharodon carcharias]|uniref:uncharacterized protein C1orf112 homolog isoform X3 n=1 Tax=Carcharodon carcharias TaxID=13397 RepID=UPI001B7E9F5B|nr:uncharacterized protein C1orf112 homolog isoform X3 [Carcharodon carcharias]
MSRNCLLEEVCQWNEEMCKKKMEPVLPDLICIYQSTESNSEQLRVLKILTDKFVPHISLAEIEQIFFSQALPTVITLFDELANKLSQQAGGLSSQSTELQAALRNTIQSQVQLLEVLMNIVHHMCTFEEALTLASIHSLSLAVFHVLQNTFNHCKDSETLYSGRLHLVADLLQSLFKEAYSLQKGFMELLDRIVLESADATGDDIACMVIVVHNVLKICSVISKMDHALHANTWKFLIKISVKHRVLIETKLPHDELVAGLCGDILYSFNSCLQLAEQMNQPAEMGNANSTDCKLFQKTMKLCRFFANTLVHYVKEFIDFLSKSCHLLHQLYLQVYSKITPSLYAPVLSDGPCDQIASVVPVALDALVSRLVSFRPFVEMMLGDNQDLSSELAFPQCLLLINVMGKLTSQSWEVQSLWCSGCQFSEEGPRVGMHIIGYCTQSPHVNCITGYRCMVFPCTVKSCCVECYQLSHLSLLLRRMLFLMAADHQVVFVEKFSPKETSNLLLWRQVSIKALTPELQKPVTSDITRTAIDQCLKWQSSKRALGELEQVNVALAALEAVCHAHGEDLNLELQLSITETLCQMWTALTVEQVLSQHCAQQTAALLLSLVASLIRVVGATLITQVILFLSCLLPLNPPDHVRLAALDFLGSLGKIVIPPDVQGTVLPKLPCLFASFLADKSWLILQHALQGFTLFAEETSHEEVVPHSLESGETKSKVVNFLNKVITTVQCRELQVERLKQENTILDAHFASLNLCALNDPVVMQPSVKRARLEQCEEEEYESALQTAENAFKTLQTLIQRGAAPERVMVRLKALQTTIIALNTGR